MLFWPGEAVLPQSFSAILRTETKPFLRQAWTMSVTTLQNEPICDMLDEKISAALRTNPYLPSRSLRFETSEGRVTLHGQVSSWYQKQMAQETLLRLDGVDGVENRLEVCWA